MDFLFADFLNHFCQWKKQKKSQNEHIFKLDYLIFQCFFLYFHRHISTIKGGKIKVQNKKHDVGHFFS